MSQYRKYKDIVREGYYECIREVAASLNNLLVTYAITRPVL